MTQSSLPPVDAATLAQMPACNAIDLILPDMNGLLRGKRITRDALEKIYADGVCLPMSLIATDITGNTVEETGLGYDIGDRSAEHPSELQSLMRISYAVFCFT